MQGGSRVPFDLQPVGLLHCLSMLSCDWEGVRNTAMEVELSLQQCGILLLH
uniref:Uncharacterized protein n=2 Tax=Anguilla anguilla TaxID=7936 RepID=A0A0E9SJC3_ANGAN